MITKVPDCADPADTVAVVGIGCRFPKAAGVDEFWRLLTENSDAISAIPEDRFDIEPYYTVEPGIPGKTVSRHGGFLDEPFAFDASFFGISRVEARRMDPQQRLLLQVVWEALEDSGIPPSSLAGSRTGVFVGQATAEYSEVSLPLSDNDIRAAAGSRLRAVTSGRISYALDLHGPSLVIDTACSSSLVAVHTARQSLLTAESDLAVAAGVNIVLSVTDAVSYSQGAMLSPDGRCKFGDASADGFVRSEGVGVLVLKRLADAERDGDPVVALLLGSAVTNDGRGSGLLLQPAVSGQTETLRDACSTAGISPHELDYVEAHGTGTGVGDGVEFRGLTEALVDSPAGRGRLKVGSVKSNIGHTEAAAGIAGLIKAVLITRHKVIPASLHVTTPHPLLAGGSVEIVRHNQDLIPAGDRALLGVSSFGISGTNAHVVVGEYVPRSLQERPRRRGPFPHSAMHLLVLSARSPRSLRRLAERYADHLEPGGTGRTMPLRDVCAAAATRRDHHPFRLWVTGSSADEIAAGLRALADGRDIPEGGTAEAGFSHPKQVAFVLPGQGSQWPGMARGLMAASPAFRAAISACDRAVRAEAGWSVIDVLAEDTALNDIEIVQPVLWAVEVALAALWSDMGVTPDVCIGHSMGEAAAAHICGAMSIEDSAAVICCRSRLMKRLAGRGTMLAVGLSADDAREVAAKAGSSVCVAVENSPTNTVLSGDPPTLRKIAQDLDAAGVLARQVKVDVAAHSSDMDMIIGDLLAGLSRLSPTACSVPMHSTVIGTRLDGRELTADYWADNLRRPVRFLDAVQTIAKGADPLFLELSPHPTLVAAIEESQSELAKTASAVPSLHRHRDETTAMLRALGRVFANGGAVEWERWFGGPAQHVPLPTYAWDEETFRATGFAASTDEVQEVRLSLHPPALRVSGLTPVPPVSLLMAALDTAAEAVGEAVMIHDARLGDDLLRISNSGTLDLRVRLAGARDGARPVTVDALAPLHADGPAITCIRGSVRPITEAVVPDTRRILHAALARCRRYVGPDEFHAMARRWGYDIDGPLLRIGQLWRRNGLAAAHLRISGTRSSLALEAGLLPMLAALPQSDAGKCLYIPTAFSHVAVHADLTPELWSVTRFATDTRHTARASTLLLDPEGQLLAEFRGVQLRRLATRPPHALQRAKTLPSALRQAFSPARVNRSPRTGSVTAQAPAAVVPDQRRAPATVAPGRPGELVRRAADVLGTTPDRINTNRSLRDQGLDSLMGVKLSKSLAAVGVEIGIGRLLGTDSVSRLEGEAVADDRPDDGPCSP